MKILPWEEFYLQTNLSLPEAVRLIIVSPEKKRGNYSKVDTSDEKRDEIKFQIKPAVTYRSSFLPVISGIGKSTQRGSEIKILMSLPFGSYALLLAVIIWGLVEGFVLAIQGDFVFSNDSTNVSKLIPVLVFIPLVVIIISAFKFEVHRNRRFLIRRLNAIIVE